MMTHLSLLVGLTALLTGSCNCNCIGRPHSSNDSCYHGKETTTCYSNDLKNAFRYFASKTDYKITTGLTDGNADEVKFSGCTPVQFLYYGRHAARFPKKKDIKNFKALLETVQKQFEKNADKDFVRLCNDDIEDITQWEMRFKKKDANAVTESGYKDAKNIAKRFKARFPKLFPDYNEKDYVLGVSEKERTNQTLCAFLNGLFKKSEIQEKVKFPEPNKRLLAFYEICKEIHGKTDNPELRAFRASELASKVLLIIKKRLGNIGLDNLTFESVRDISKLCAFEFSIYGKNEAPWCALFTKEDLEVIEFDDDLGDFYDDAYGNAFNLDMTCPVFEELLTRFRNTIKDPENVPKSILYFSHAESIKKIAAALGIAKGDKCFKRDGFCESLNRKWRSSMISPFNSNFAFVLHRCDNDEYKMLTMLNEKPVVVEGCDDALCSFDKFAKFYEGRATNCNLEEICKKT